MLDKVNEDDHEPYARFLRALGQRIRSIRKERNWTYRDMVILHGFHLSAWQGFETGKTGMSLSSLLRVAKALGIDPGTLISGISSTPDLPQTEVEEPDGKKPRKQKSVRKEPLSK